MTVVVETGAGVRNANSYVDSAFVSAYLAARNRNTDWDAATDAVQDAAVIAATDYVEKTFGRLVPGVREFEFAGVVAEGSILFTGLPSAGETLVLGDQTYTFRSTLTSPAVADEILIGVDAAGTASNVRDAIAADAANEGTTYSTGTSQNRHATAELSSATVTLTAAADGESGNLTTLGGTASNVTLTAFSGGKDGGSQPLTLPRVGLYDESGRAVLGIPRDWKWGVAEYAERARLATLDPDPTVDPTGASLQSVREKVGPIEEERVFVPGTHLSQQIRPYPSADRLIRKFTLPPGTFRA